MAAAKGAGLIKIEENGEVFVPVTTSVVPSIKNYFDVIGDNERKCRLCSSIVKVHASSSWGLKSHFKNKHPTEWTTNFQTAVTPRKSKVSFAFQRIDEPRIIATTFVVSTERQ